MKDSIQKRCRKKKLKGIGTKKNELFGIFQKGGFSSEDNTNFNSKFLEEIKIRKDNGQNKFQIILFILIKIFFNFRKL